MITSASISGRQFRVTAQARLSSDACCSRSTTSRPMRPVAPTTPTRSTYSTPAIKAEGGGLPAVSGKRQSAEQRPMAAMAALQGIGLLSAKR